MHHEFPFRVHSPFFLNPITVSISFPREWVVEALLREHSVAISLEVFCGDITETIHSGEGKVGPSIVSKTTAQRPGINWASKGFYSLPVAGDHAYHGKRTNNKNDS